MLRIAMEFDLKQGTAVLERTPGVLRAMLDGLDAARTDADEGPGTWSPYVIVGYLIHGERTNWIPRAHIILAQGPDRRFTPFDRFVQIHDGPRQTLSELLDEFARLRKESLDALAGWRVTEVQLDLTGEHPEFGAVTPRQLLSTWVAHDHSHVAQIARVMAKQYREAVGPWRGYLPILDR